MHYTVRLPVLLFHENNKFDIVKKNKQTNNRKRFNKTAFERAVNRVISNSQLQTTDLRHDEVTWHEQMPLSAVGIYSSLHRYFFPGMW